MLDEFQEFFHLTSGEALLEVSDETGRTLCRPALAGWDLLRVPESPPSALNVVESEINGQPYRALATRLDVGAHRYRLTAAISMATEYAALRRFGILMAALVPGVLLIAAVGGFWLSGRALLPVDRMTQDVKRISVRDPGGRLLVPPADDELRRLAETFNAMLARWQEAFNDVIRLTADASHELRTPVSLARTTAELALNRPRSIEEYRTALSEVHAHTERMSVLVDDLLTVARADAGVESPPMERMDLRTIASDAATEIRPAVDTHALRFRLTLPDDAVPVVGNPESLHRLMVILLDNAVKYTPSPGDVSMSVLLSSNGSPPAAILAVTNTGPGISAEDRPRVFDRFYRGTQARQLAPEGAGLGLSIAQTITDRHGGSIEISAVGVGQGCTVKVQLPFAGA